MPAAAKKFQMFCLCAAFLALGALSAKGAGATIPLTPAAVIQAAQTLGPAETLRRLDSQGRPPLYNFEAVLEKISEGSDDWLRAADALLPGSDAGFTEGLFMAVAEALPHTPESVLKLLKGNRWPLAQVCDAPFVEAPEDVWREHLQKAEVALEGVAALELAPERDLCLKHVRWALADYPEPKPADIDLPWPPAR